MTKVVSISEHRAQSAIPLNSAHHAHDSHTHHAIGAHALDRQLHIAVVIPPNTGSETRHASHVRRGALHVLSLLRNHFPSSRLQLCIDSPAEPEFECLPQVEVRSTHNWRETPNLIIDFGGTLSGSTVGMLRAAGAKVVNYSTSPDYLIDCGAFGDSSSAVPSYHDIDYDEVWVTPQVARASFFLMHTIGRNTIKVAPYVWDPAVQLNGDGCSMDIASYEPALHQPTVSVVPPAIDTARSCLFPLLIAEHAQRNHLSALEHVLVRHGRMLLAQNDTFASLLNKLDISRNGIVTFEHSNSGPALIGGRSDIFVSYQADFGFGDDIVLLCWMGYPVVHNWELGADLGYYYRGSDLAEGAKRLAAAMKHQDGDWIGYRERQRKAIARFLPCSADSQNKYARLITDLFGQ